MEIQEQDGDRDSLYIMSEVLDGDPIVVLSDVDDDDDLGPSELFRATMSPELNQYEDVSTDVQEYYLGREIDYVSGPIISAGIIDQDSIWVGTAQGVIRSWSSQGTAERDLKLQSKTPISAVTFVQDHWAIGDIKGRLFLTNEFGEIRGDLVQCHDDLISYTTSLSSSIFTSSWDGAVNVIDNNQFDISHHYQPCCCPVEYLLVPSLTQIWTAAADGRARLLDIRVKDCVQVLRSDEGAGSPIRCLTMGNGQTLYMSHGHGKIAAIDLRTGKILRRYFGHSDVVNRIVLAGERLISAGDDIEIRLFDINNGVSIDKLGGHRQPITNLVVMGTSLISCDAEGAIRRYDLETIERFHSRRAAERDQEKKKAMEVLAAQQAAAKASTKGKKGKKGSKKKKK